MLTVQPELVAKQIFGRNALYGPAIFAGVSVWQHFG
jgi:hypothetical protein